jgi:hypothetical protein
MTSVLAGAAALAFYAYIRQRSCGVAGQVDLQWPVETHTSLEHAPNTWGEAIYLAKEALRWVRPQGPPGRWCLRWPPCAGLQEPAAASNATAGDADQGVECEQRDHSHRPAPAPRNSNRKDLSSAPGFSLPQARVRGDARPLAHG